ncbi:MAG: hypothetical protein ACI8PZ_001043 [Myxococcota bacterium]|jgi:hypothetical protein
MFLIILASSLSALAGGPMLTTSGACPGAVDVTIAGLTPSGSAAILRGTRGGSDIIPAGPCAGMESGLAGLSYITTLRDSDFDGVIAVSPVIPRPACGDMIQALDVATCTLTNIAPLGDAPGDCVPSGARVPLDTLGANTASGCWDGNPCAYDEYAWDSSHGQNFQAFGEEISCTGGMGCMQNVGVTTYSGSDTVCQGAWDVECDGEWVGRLDTLGMSCSGSATSNGCSIEFPARMCGEVTLMAVEDGDITGGCCGGTQPDTMITSVSAW